MENVIKLISDMVASGGSVAIWGIGIYMITSLLKLGVALFTVIYLVRLLLQTITKWIIMDSEVTKKKKGY